MSDKPQKPGEALLALSPSSSDSSSPEGQWLELLLSEITRGIGGTTQQAFLIREIVESAVDSWRKELDSVNRAGVQREIRFANRIADLQIALAEFTDRIESVVHSQKTLVGANVDARKGIERATKRLEETGEHLLQIRSSHEPEQEGDAPRWMHQWNRRFLNFLWPIAVRTGPEAARWALKLVIGSGILAAVGKIIHEAVSR